MSGTLTAEEKWTCLKWYLHQKSHDLEDRHDANPAAYSPYFYGQDNLVDEIAEYMMFLDNEGENNV